MINDGDYAVFAPLLANIGLEQQVANELKNASHLERLFNASDTSKKLKHVMPKLEELRNTQSPLFNLFYQSLADRLSWYKKSSLGLQEQDLANKYLKRNDYVRAVVYAMESLISRQTDLNKQDIHDFNNRRDSYGCLIDSKDNFKEFKEPRNTMVHDAVIG